VTNLGPCRQLISLCDDRSSNSAKISLEDVAAYGSAAAGVAGVFRWASSHRGRVLGRAIGVDPRA
jgi:hypothetical protein